MTDRKLVYIASPYAGDIEYNTRMAIEYCRYAVGYGVVPLAPHLLLPRFLYELNPEERELGIQMGLQLLSLCSELWVFGSRISDGMSREIAEAQKLGIPVKYIGKIEMTGVKDMQYGIWAKRSAASVCGAAEAWFKSDGKPITFDTYEEAAEKAKWYMENLASANVSYYPREMKARRWTKHQLRACI
jgi:hypothetical protein